MGIRILMVALGLLSLAGCASLDQPIPALESQLFDDAAFRAPSEPVGADDLFSLSEPMRAYLHSEAFKTQQHGKGAQRGLINALYQKKELKLEYDSTQTRTAAQAFSARQGNCLSLVIMTAAFAKELGMEVQYYNVQAGRTWSRNGDIYVASTHVNLSLGKRRLDRAPGSRGRPDETLLIDFLPAEEVSALEAYPVAEDDIVAMFMNNRAAEALMQERLDDAYWWARSATKRRPSFVPAYNTLGAIYQRHGNAVMAERAFKAALARESENVVVMQNLVGVLAALGKGAESNALAAQVARIEPFPPFHFFTLGMEAMRNNDYAKARTLFAREVDRDPNYDEFHFWLAIACIRLGDTGKAQEQLRLARDTSTSQDSTRRYSAKLDRLRLQNRSRDAH